MPDNDPRSGPRLGFIGLGAMGGRMARRLLAAGYDLTVHDRARERARSLEQGGAKFAPTNGWVGGVGARNRGGRVSGIAEEPVVAPLRRRSRWTDGVLVGLVAAIVSTLILLLAGALSGRGLHILADAGMAALPSAVRAVTGVSPALSYLLSHTLLYMLAGVAALALAGLVDRLPPLVTGLLLVIVIIEFGFLVLTTESQAAGRLAEVTWRFLLIAHAFGDVVFALGILRAHPSLRQALVRGYEW